MILNAWIEDTLLVIEFFNFWLHVPFNPALLHILFLYCVQEATCKAKVEDCNRKCHCFDVVLAKLVRIDVFSIVS